MYPLAEAIKKEIQKARAETRAHEHFLRSLNTPTYLAMMDIRALLSEEEIKKAVRQFNDVRIQAIREKWRPQLDNLAPRIREQVWLEARKEKKRKFIFF